MCPCVNSTTGVGTRNRRSGCLRECSTRLTAALSSFVRLEGLAARTVLDRLPPSPTPFRPAHFLPHTAANCHPPSLYPLHRGRSMAAPRGFVPSSRAERGTRLGGATVPGQYTILIRVTPPNGYHWHVISEGKTLARGEAASDF